MEFKNNRLKLGFQVTSTSGGTLSLVSSSLQRQLFTGSSNHSVNLPNATQLGKTGVEFQLINESTGTISVYLNDGTTLLGSVSSDKTLTAICTNISSSNGQWIVKTESLTQAGIGSSLFNAPQFGDRALVYGWGSSSRSEIQMLAIATGGQTSNFGFTSQNRGFLASGSSSTRGIWAGGTSTGGNVGRVATIDYVTIQTTSNAINFGSLTQAKTSVTGCSNQTRMLIWGGNTASLSQINEIEYLTIASPGSGTSFGTMPFNRIYSAACSSGVRGVMAGGDSGGGSSQSAIHFVLFATLSNSTSFGTLTQARYALSGCSNSTRGVFGGGFAASASAVIDFITIATESNATSFGNLVSARELLGNGTASEQSGLFFGGIGVSGRIERVSMNTASNSLNFGTLLHHEYGLAACSNSHGGLS